ncbi:RNA polymerase factor sigma-54 [Ferrovibrio sp.]|uniref:RNA polymerase factor sigma-54 n=1 Tax=Ferrovibrio sp. TaxID=1917215 RepID=UPI0025B9724E|nr:RNA polymerase factor sigma-54 [Ferrovibrio sp.]MBX3454565.1 RNA polymerase factor sigma-54 [Ferrovibrio sp.]
MAIGPRLELRQGQALVMTPQLQQAIKLLQLSNLELTTYVEQELERNPLLERLDGEGGGEDGRDPFEVTEGEPDAARLDLGSDASVGAANEAIDADHDNTFTNDSAMDAVVDGYVGSGDSPMQGRGGDMRFEDGESSLEQTLSEQLSLRDHAQEQWRLIPVSATDRLIGQALIDSLDEAGYLTEPLAELAERLGAPEAAVEAVLAKLQTIEPVGVFARSLKECLALQLRDRDRLDPAMQALLDHLELLAKRDIPGLLKICGVDQEDLTDMIKEIRALNPKPGLMFGGEPVQTLIPDVFVRRGPDGAWLVELNNDTLPRVLVNTRYYAKVARSAKQGGNGAGNGSTDKEREKATKTYLSDCLNSANWLVKSLDQRAQTILKVASEIVRQQEAFLRLGVDHLKPLNLKSVAEAIEMHESTVSRVTSNKTIATPRGIFEMKYFFTASIGATDGGDSFSAEAIRHRIKDLIDSESAEDVLSDDKIVEILAGKGVDIARRTVAKYREAMNISSSVERRRLKKAGLLPVG